MKDRLFDQERNEAREGVWGEGDVVSELICQRGTMERWFESNFSRGKLEEEGELEGTITQNGKEDGM